MESKLTRSVILFAILTIFSLNYVVAAENIFFSGFIFSDESVVINDKSFIITLEWDKRNIMLKSGKEIYFVPKTKCERIYNIRFCFHNTVYDVDEKKDKINISIYSLSPTIKITRTIDKSRLFVGEEAEISVNIKNEGPLAAENFSFIDSFSDKVEITDVSFCNLNGSEIYWRGLLRENDTLKCNYRIKPIDEFERSFRAKVEYFDGIKNKEEFSEAISIKADPFLVINQDFNDSDKKIFVGENTTLIINISNKHPDEDIKIAKVEIVLPKGLSFISTERISIGNESVGQGLSRSSEDILEWNGEIKQNRSKIFVVKLQGRYVGASDVFVRVYYKLNEKEGFVEKKSNIEVVNQEIDVQTSFKDDETFDSGQEKWFKVYLKNPSSIIKLKNIKIQYNTTLLNIPDSYISEINTTSSQLVLNRAFTIPFVTSKTSYPFNLIVRYETEFGESFDKIFEYTLNVEPTAGLTITHDISKTTVEEGEEFTITTKIKNERNKDIKNVKVVDTTHSDFVKEGMNSAIININAHNEVSVYSYKVTAPKVIKDTDFIFKTTASYSEENITYVYEKESTIRVTPKRLELDITRTIEPSTIFMGQIADVNYIISNPETERIQNIRLKFPLEQIFDLVGNDSYFVDKLEPGETIKINNKHNIRAKLNGTQILPPTLFIYEDSDGNVFDKNSSSNQIDIKYSYIPSASFFIEKSVLNQNIIKGEPLKIVVKIKNVGTEKGKIDVYDLNNNWSLEIEPQNYEFISYELNITRTGKLKLEPTVGIYEILNKTVKTISNELEIEIKEAPIEKSSEIINLKEESPAQKTEIGENITELPKVGGIIGFIEKLLKPLIEIFR